MFRADVDNWPYQKLCLVRTPHPGLRKNNYIWGTGESVLIISCQQLILYSGWRALHISLTKTLLLAYRIWISPIRFSFGKCNTPIIKLRVTGIYIYQFNEGTKYLSATQSTQTNSPLNYNPINQLSTNTSQKKKQDYEALNSEHQIAIILYSTFESLLVTS